MRVNELKNFIKSIVPGEYYSNRFPVSSNAPDNCSAVKLTGGFPPDQWTGKRQPSFQVRVRGVDDQECEERAYAIHKALTNLKNVKIGDDSIVIIRAMSSDPLMIGEDENNRIIFSMNFDCVVRPR
ncbi:minor capsid protein [Ornithinibacillus sp. JPR2-1]|uniref:minor capsid protein n=1 Tax=Ornithinibacillus sp. JPR2-1 TaxID=2094019 RepID=UPI0031D6D430